MKKLQCNSKKSSILCQKSAVVKILGKWHAFIFNEVKESAYLAYLHYDFDVVFFPELLSGTRGQIVVHLDNSQLTDLGLGQRTSNIQGRFDEVTTEERFFRRGRRMAVAGTATRRCRHFRGRSRGRATVCVVCVCTGHQVQRGRGCCSGRRG